MIRALRNGIRRKSGAVFTGVLHAWHLEMIALPLEKSTQAGRYFNGSHIQARKGLNQISPQDHCVLCTGGK